ncbi:MAG: hypothetical protein M3315_09015 [Actinomycetota bacterium]|nr:hypothetical protein [Actinomycetota bacterium]MDQ3921781.1 hypothetical protein [Actinomycetota bacterium]
MVEDGSMRAVILEGPGTNLEEEMPVPELRRRSSPTGDSVRRLPHRVSTRPRTKPLPEAGCLGLRDLGMGRDSAAKKGTRPEEVMRRGFVGEGID